MYSTHFMERLVAEKEKDPISAAGIKKCCSYLSNTSSEKKIVTCKYGLVLLRNGAF